MRIGDTLAIDIGDLEVNFEEYSSDSIFPTAKIFDFENARQLDNYTKWVKPEEKHGFNGVVNGVFCMQDKFQICIFSTSSDTAKINSIISKLPNSDKMHKFTIEAQWSLTILYLS